jgi:hypothetical protein
MQFKGVDFYRIDDLLSDEERMVRDTVRRFVDDRSSINTSKKPLSLPDSFLKWQRSACSEETCRKNMAAPT